MSILFRFHLAAIALLLVSGCRQEKVTETIHGDGESLTASPSDIVPPGRMREPRDIIAQSEAKTGTFALETDPALVALSPEEAAWLSKNGFPSKSELENLQALDIKDLERRSRELRDAKATTLLGLRRAADGDARGAVISLDYAARLGSLYAREQLAFAELQAATGYTPGSDIAVPPSLQVIFAARMEVAKMLGDHQAERYIRQVTGGLDRGKYADQILRQTSEFMRQIGEDAQLKGTRPPGPTPRPNEELWNSLQANPTSPVTVYGVGAGP